jgi:hypothetical protein
MENRRVYFTNPANLVSLWVFLFTLWVTWSKLDGKVKDLERRVNKLEEADLETKLREIKIDLDWIKKELQKLSK